MRIFTSLLILFALTGCGNDHHTAAHQNTHQEMTVSHAVCKLSPTAHPNGKKISGVVTFTQTPSGVKVVADVRGLTPGKHGFHIHEFGDITHAQGKGTGGHYNPHGHKHDLPGGKERHVGDLGNLTANAKGFAHYEKTDAHMNLAHVIGRGIIVHDKEDDGGQPTGNAGARIAQGVIGLAKGK